ncbi:FCS-Like Zinc finger 16-like [Panicum virgatum]|uniref:FLZ-type domain-containing protein n=1 Tax=Panicum virgatum TaxID=38727 RepID=A0A8T0T2J1_PANVG|nr:FCS-Like Zinc finger 16-like [Panicum virgatum]KAG2605391.1 hypothetical protein PVAP13_4NG077100 [Panicum virgatum]KAG2605392.1 hypothetical protein PVAP13_4NG077100 [Panicum virgatum]
MSTATRKRPRNSGSASRSSGGSTPSPSPFAMRRTTSLSDLAAPPQEMVAGRAPARTAMGEASAAGAGSSVWGAGMKRHSASADCFTVPEAAFLKVCGLCERGLGPGRDTFIYMGEVAFCSQECRQHKMNLDELREKKCSTPAGGGGGDGSDPSGKSSTIAAA